MFTNLSKTAKIMMAATVAVCFVLLILGVILITLLENDFKPLLYSVGIAVGCFHSVIKIILLEKTINKTLEMDKETASGIVKLHFFGRYFLTILILVVVAVFRDKSSLIGTIVGILSLQIAAYVTNIVLKKYD